MITMRSVDLKDNACGKSIPQATCLQICECGGRWQEQSAGSRSEAAVAAKAGLLNTTRPQVFA